MQEFYPKAMLKHVQKQFIAFNCVFLSLANLCVAAPRDTTIAEKHFSKQALNDDISYFKTVVERVHPNMYHNISKERYRLLTDSVRNELRDNMAEREAWPLLSRLGGALNEGHTVFDFPDSLLIQLKNGARILFPVSFSQFKGGNFIVRADGSIENKLLPGDQVTGINGIKASKLIDTLSAYAGGFKTFRAIDVCRNLILCLYLYHINSPYTISYLHDGKPLHVILRAVSWPELQANRATRTKDLLPEPEQVDYIFTDTYKNYACLAINSLTEKPAVFKHFLDSCFTILKAKPAAKLIVDLRRNGGGNSVLGETLLDYITDKPFRMSGGDRWKVSREYKDQIKQRMQGEGSPQIAHYLTLLNGSILTAAGGKPQKPPHNPLQYKGKVYVLIGPNTFSSANMLSNTIQDYHLATLVGEPSGEPANDYGELIFLRLPNTGFTFCTSTKQFVRANGKREDQNPVLPKYWIADNPLTGQDEVLDFVKGL